MIVQQVMMFALAGHSVLGQVTPSKKPAPEPATDTAAVNEADPKQAAPAPEAKKAQAPAAAPETAPNGSTETAAPDAGAEEAPATDPVAAVPEESAPPVEGAPSEEAVEADDNAQAEGSVSVGAGVAAGATETAEEASPAAEESEPAPINPRPEGEKELFGKHPVDLDSMYFKPGTGVVFNSKDKLFSLGMRLRVQMRTDLASEKDGETSHTFGIRRARLQFKGHAWGEHNTFKAELAFSPRDLSMRDGVSHNTPLLDWYTEFTHLRDLSLRLGQYKLLYSRQRVVSSGDQEFVDRSLAQDEFHLDRDIGFHFFSEDLFGLGLFRYYTGFTINEGRDVWEQESMTEGTEGSWQYLARVEVLPFGDFDDYSEVDFTRENKARLSLGAAYAHSENGTRERGYLGGTFTDGGTVDNENLTADATFKWAGLTALGEVYFRDGERGSAAPDVPGPDDVALVRKGIGGFAQVSYLIPKLPLGVGARYSAIGRGWFDESESSLVDEREIGGQLGWYMAGHNLKLQGDYFHLWSEEAKTAGDRVRIQLQFAY